jgi:hypothetical protein
VIVTESQLDSESAYSVFPNPFNEQFHLILPDGHAAILEVLNPLGQKVKEQSCLGNTDVTLTGQPKGIYMIKIREEFTIRTIRVIKQ